MTPEGFKKAQDLLPLIEVAKTNLNRWETATSFKSGAEISCHFEGGKTNYSYVKPHHIPFEVAKALSIAGYKKELEKLENEFNSL